MILTALAPTLPLGLASNWGWEGFLSPPQRLFKANIVGRRVTCLLMAFASIPPWVAIDFCMGSEMGEFPLPPHSSLVFSFVWKDSVEKDGVSYLCATDDSFSLPALPPVFLVSMIQAYGKKLAIKYWCPLCLRIPEILNYPGNLHWPLECLKILTIFLFLLMVVTPSSCALP